MLARALVLSAVAALGSGQDENILRKCAVCPATATTDSFVNCCGSGHVLAPGGDQCVREIDGLFCSLCQDCDINKPPTIGSNAPLNGAGVGGGSSTGREVANGMEGWADAPFTRFDNFPRFIVGAWAAVPDRDVADDFYLKYACINDGGWCDIYFFTYQCRNCKSANSGELHAKLISDGWVRNTCGPTFSVTPDGVEHHFTTWHKEIEDVAAPSWNMGEPVVQTPVGSAADFVWGAIQTKHVSCSSQTTQAACEGRGFPNCGWVDGECITSWCPKKPFQGPSAGCLICPLDANNNLNVADAPWR